MASTNGDGSEAVRSNSRSLLGSATGCDDPSERDEFLIKQLREYQENLINRRWLCLGSFSVFAGLFYHAVVNTPDVQVKTTIGCVGVIVSILVLRLVNLAAQRIERVQLTLTQQLNFTIADVPIDGKFHVDSVTTLIYLVIIAVSAGWLIGLLYHNLIVFGILTPLFIGNLFCLRWKSSAFR